MIDYYCDDVFNDHHGYVDHGDDDDDEDPDDDHNDDGYGVDDDDDDDDSDDDDIVCTVHILGKCNLSLGWPAVTLQLRR